MDDYYITKREAYEALRDKLAYSVRGPLLPSQAHLIAEIINDIPTADVAPVVHAKALNPIKLEYCDISIIAATCSNCGKDILVDDSYCSNCGARMDGGENK